MAGTTVHFEDQMIKVAYYFFFFYSRICKCVFILAVGLSNKQFSKHVLVIAKLPGQRLWPLHRCLGTPAAGLLVF